MKIWGPMLSTVQMKVITHASLHMVKQVKITQFKITKSGREC